MNIFILSEPIQAGKSTNLMAWCRNKNLQQDGRKTAEVWGIVAPDGEDGLRRFVALSPTSSKEVHVEVAADEGMQRIQQEDPDIFSVGKKCFYFKHSSFIWAIHLIHKIIALKFTLECSH
eukprot:Phypoly_transcript_15758.p1 GENE.Phypoly_transcript_15758~~Phypoly_transcript_15758.p1  ORF type:complete len:120 (+),score=19.63 Phypoly_transcript_15758:130-489(+)